MEVASAATGQKRGRVDAEGVGMVISRSTSCWAGKTEGAVGLRGSRVLWVSLRVGSLFSLLSVKRASRRVDESAARRVAGSASRQVSQVWARQVGRAARASNLPGCSRTSAE